MQAPVMIMNTNSKRESGRKAQFANIQAAKVPILKEDKSLTYPVF